VGQTLSDNEQSAAALFQSLGYEQGHTAWILRRTLVPALPAPALPPGYRFRPYAPGVDGLAIYELIDEAFSEWRNADSEPMGFENWAAYALRDVPQEFVVLLEYDPEAAGGRPAGATPDATPGATSTTPATGRLVGASVGNDYESQGEGWIEQIAVRREHRGRGLGGALLAESFRRFLAAGRVSAGVSTDSRTGALGLYEHAGMAVVRSYTRWVKTGL
jgi:ribosomal protein S18 acetylase RimI-like enzyme